LLSGYTKGLIPNDYYLDEKTLSGLERWQV
jgi:hypothetical protein